MSPPPPIPFSLLPGLLGQKMRELAILSSLLFLFLIFKLLLVHDMPFGLFYLH